MDLWTLRQLERLAAREPDRVRAALARAVECDANIREEVILGAAEEDAIMLAEAAQLLERPLEEVRTRVVELRRRNGTLVDEGGPNGARLRGSGIAVWEIAREARSHGSVEGLRREFPHIPEVEIEAALDYAEQHPEQTDAIISRYESLFAMRSGLG